MYPNLKTMKTTLLRLNNVLAALLMVILPAITNAQLSSLEFTAGAGNPSTSGATVASQAISFQANINNPVGTSFIPFLPVVTTTFSFSNQQYTSVPTSEIATGTGLSFGANINNAATDAASVSVFEKMSLISTPANNNFTSVANGTAGTGIDIATNRAVTVFSSVRPLYHSAAVTNSRYYYGDITITFNVPVINPVIQLVGLGGYFTSSGNTLGFSTELELASAGVTLQKISGSSELQVTSNKILNNAPSPNSTTGSGAATGSVKATGFVSQIKFKVYVRGDGGNTRWSSSSMHPGDLWMIGVSVGSSSALPVPVKLSSFTATLNNNKTDLRWSTATEINASHFVVERSLDGVNFSDAGMVFAAGNSTETLHYNFSDNLQTVSAAVIWYRLRTVDIDGMTEYSDTRIIRIGKMTEKNMTIQSFPNPATTELRISIPADWQTKKVQYELISLSGQIVKRVQANSSNQTEVISIATLAPGMYVARVSCGDQVAQQRIIKQ